MNAQRAQAEGADNQLKHHRSSTGSNAQPGKLLITGTILGGFIPDKVIHLCAAAVEAWWPEMTSWSYKNDYYSIVIKVVWGCLLVD